MKKAPRKPRHPTYHRPGTTGKVRVMMRRWATGQLLFHPDDAAMDAEGIISRPLLTSNTKTICMIYHEERTYRECLERPDPRALLLEVLAEALDLRNRLGKNTQN